MDLHRFVASAALVLLAPLSCAVAFESREHIRVSNDALRIVIDYVKNVRPPLGGVEKVDVDVLNKFLTGIERSDTQAVTSQTRESRLFRNLQHLWTGGKDHAPITYGELVKLVDYISNPLIEFRIWGDQGDLPRDAGDLDLAFLQEIGIDFWSMAVSSHLNNEHFQDELLRAFWWWHKAALLVAVQEHNLFTALVLNAFADHFLEDFFAPGHMQTPRRRLHDVASLGIHDRYNTHGAPFVVDNQGQLTPLMNTIADPSILDLKDRLSQLFSKDRPKVTLYGDNDLERNPDQRPLMTVVVARSILDIVESYACHQVKNSFAEFWWKSRQRRDFPDKSMIFPVQAAIPFGYYLFEPERFGSYSPLLGISVDFQALPQGSGTTRMITTLETIPIGLPPPGNYLRSEDGTAWSILPQVGLGIGYSYVVDDGYRAHGPTARLLFPLPVDTQFSVGAGIRDYIGRGTDSWRVSYGGTFEMGYGVFFARLGIGHDYYIAPNGRVRDSVAFIGGVTATLPLSRIQRFLP